MTDTSKNELFERLENGLQEVWKMPIGERHETLAQISIAISLKRIADGIDHICNYGIIAGTE